MIGNDDNIMEMKEWEISPRISVPSKKYSNKYLIYN